MLTLESSRLRLRPMVDDDASFLVALLNEPAFLRHVGDKGVRTVDDARGWMAGPQLSYREHGFGMLVVEPLDGDSAMGICGLLQRDWLPEPDLGFAFLPEYSGRGLALEAAQAVLRDARERLALGRVQAIVSPGNVASLRLLRKLDFIEVDRLTPPAAEQAVLLFSLDLAPPARLDAAAAATVTAPLRRVAGMRG